MLCRYVPKNITWCKSPISTQMVPLGLTNAYIPDLPWLEGKTSLQLTHELRSQWDPAKNFPYQEFFCSKNDNIIQSAYNSYHSKQDVVTEVLSAMTAFLYLFYRLYACYMAWSQKLNRSTRQVKTELLSTGNQKKNSLKSRRSQFDW